MRKLLVSGGVAIAAAAVSLCCGGAAANAQEVSTGHVSAQVVNHVKEATAGVLRNAQQRDVQQKSPMVPTGEVLSFLADSLNLAGRDVLTGKVVPAGKNDTAGKDGKNNAAGQAGQKGSVGQKNNAIQKSIADKNNTADQNEAAVAFVAKLKDLLAQVKSGNLPLPAPQKGDDPSAQGGNAPSAEEIMNIVKAFAPRAIALASNFMHAGVAIVVGTVASGIAVGLKSAIDGFLVGPLVNVLLAPVFSAQITSKLLFIPLLPVVSVMVGWALLHWPACALLVTKALLLSPVLFIPTVLLSGIAVTVYVVKVVLSFVLLLIPGLRGIGLLIGVGCLLKAVLTILGAISVVGILMLPPFVPVAIVGLDSILGSIPGFFIGLFIPVIARLVIGALSGMFVGLKLGTVVGLVGGFAVNVLGGSADLMLAIMYAFFVNPLMRKNSPLNDPQEPGKKIGNLIPRPTDYALAA